MRRHVRAETLAKRQLGVLSARRAARIEAHMSKCAVCIETEAALIAVSGLLTATQLPPMPQALVQRLDIVIAGESTARAVGFSDNAAMQTTSAADLAGSPEGDAGTSGRDEDGPVLIPGRPDLPRRTKRARASRRFHLPSLSSPLVLRGLAATAAIVVVAGAGFLLARGQMRAHPAAPSSGVHAAAPRAAPVPSLKGAANAALRQRVSVHYQLKGKTATTTAFVSKANFLRRTLARQVRKDVSQSVGFGNTYSPPSPSAGPGRQAQTAGFSIPQMASCLSRINAGRTVLLVAVAHFLGRPARIIVLRSAASASILDIAIVGPACSASGLDLIFRTTIPAG